MAKKLTTPSITQAEFDAIAPRLRDALKKWWEDEAQSFDAAVAGTASVWDGMPEIDSKAVVKASPVIRTFTGSDLDPRMIKRGGYASFDELANDLLPKLRAACPAGAAAEAAPSANQDEVESINVQRSAVAPIETAPRVNQDEVESINLRRSAVAPAETAPSANQDEVESINVRRS
jgi:hypothetical protein